MDNLEKNILFILFVFLINSVLINIVWNSFKYNITPTPTSYFVQKKLLENCPLKIEGKIIELGSGWGTLTLALAHHYPMQEVKGYEISPVPYFISQALKSCFKLSSLQFIRKNFFSVSLQEAGLVVCYLYPAAMLLLKNKFEKELKPGTFVISHTFAVPGWSPYAVCKVNDLYSTPIYFYQT